MVVSGPTPPPVLYKYLPAERFDFLEKRKIRFTPPVSFNDPFDCRAKARAFTILNAVKHVETIESPEEIESPEAPTPRKQDDALGLDHSSLADAFESSRLRRWQTVVRPQRVRIDSRTEFFLHGGYQKGCVATSTQRRR
jgi:hypothetical protein